MRTIYADGRTTFELPRLVSRAADAVGSATLTAAHVQLIVAAVVEAVDRVQTRRDPVARLALVVAVVALIVQWLSYRQDATEYARPDPAPGPPVVVVVPAPPAKSTPR